MRIFFFIIFFLSISPIFSQDSIVVKLSLNDCSNCYGGFCIIDDLPSNTKITLVVKEEDKKITEYFIRKHLELKNNYTYVYSDSLYNSLSTSPTSEVFLFQSEKITQQGPLSKFPQTLSHTQSHIDSLFSMPDSVFVSKFQLFNAIKGYYIITDMIFGKIYVINSDSGIIKDIIATDFVDLKELQQNYGVDSISMAVFEKLLPQIKTTKNDQIKFQEPIEFNNNLLIPVYVPCPVYDTAARTLTLASYPAYVLWDLEQSTIHEIIYTKNPTVNHNGIDYMILANCFPLDSTSIIIQCQSSDSLRPISLSSFGIKDGFLYELKSYNYTIPPYYLTTGLNNNVLGLLIRYPLVFTKLSPLIFNLETDETTLLPYENELFKFKMNTIVDHKFNFRLMDAWHSNQGSHILYMNDQDQFIFDTFNANNKLVSSIEIFNELKSSVLDIIIEDHKNFLVLTTASQILRYKLK
jgi:hypothetical protein